jgi:hypothetical protein
MRKIGLVKLYTVELHLTGLIGTASHPDMHKTVYIIPLVETSFRHFNHRQANAT